MEDATNPHLREDTMRCTLVATCFFLALAAPAAAAEFHAGLQSAPRAGSPREAAAALLRADARFDLASVDLVHRETLSLGAFRTVRFDQVHEGLPVIGGAVAVRVAPDGSSTAVALSVARELRVSPTPTVDQARVRELLAARVDGRIAAARLVFRLAVLPEEHGDGRLVWQVDAGLGRNAWRYLVDAHRAELLDARPLMVHVLGRVYAISRVNTPTTTDAELTDLDVSTPQVLTGFSGGLKVTQYVSGGTTSDYVAQQTLNPNSGTDFLYDPPANDHDATDGFAQVMLYYHMARGRSWYASTLGIDFSASKWTLLAIANVTADGTPYDNAGTLPDYPMADWGTNNMIVVGQGTYLDFAIDSDVILHEFTHYVSAQAVGYANAYASSEYGRSPFSGAIDEGISDYFASTINGNAILGETTLAPYGQERDLTNTSKVCPTDMNGEVHDDGEIIGSLSWTMREAFGAEKADQLVWGAVSLLVGGATFGDYGAALVQSGNDLVTSSVLTAADVQTITAAVATRGLDKCFAEIPIAASTPSKVGVRGLTFYGEQYGRTCDEMKVDHSGNPRFRQTLFHYAATTEAEDVGIKFSVSLAGDTSALNWKIYGRKGQHVGFTSSGGYGGATLTDYDWVTEPTTTASGELVIDASSTPAFEAGQSYHFLVMYQNCPDEVMTVRYDRLAPVQDDAGAQQGDGGTPGDDAGTGGGKDKGCGCRTSATTGAAPALLLFLLVLLRRR
jgi:MYXO-CTERM domain-containing protein